MAGARNVQRPRAMKRTLDEAERVALAGARRRAIVDALRQTGGNVQEAARVLGLARQNLYGHLRRLAIQPDDYRA